MTTEILFQGLFAFSLLFNLVLVGGLWWIAARQSGTARQFWRMLAAGWTLNLVGNLAWIAYDLTIGGRLPPLSPIDAFYVGRYVLVGLAFGRYPVPWPPRRGLEVVAIMVAGTLLAWLIELQPVLASTGRSWDYFLGLAMYPILDIGLIYSAVIRWWRVTGDAWRQGTALLTVAMLTYSVANWINFSIRMAAPDADSWLAALFWLFTDVLAGVAALSFLRQTRVPQERC